MTAFESKQAILNSLNELDKRQTDKVINYISALMSSRNESGYNRFKKRALHQINRALRDT